MLKRSVFRTPWLIRLGPKIRCSVSQEVIWLESGQPEDHYIITGTYDLGKFSFLARANWFGEVTSTESPDQTSARLANECLDQTFSGEWLVDVRASWSFTDSLVVTAGIDNVFDTQPDKQRPDTNFNGIFPFSRRTTPFGFKRRLLLPGGELQLGAWPLSRSVDRPPPGGRSFFLNAGRGSLVLESAVTGEVPIVSARQDKPPLQYHQEQFLNPAVRQLKPSATLAINEQSAKLQALGREIYRLGFGQSPFPVPDFVVEELRRHAHQKAYLPVQGLPQLRQAIASYHERLEGVPTSPDQILVGPGTKELMFILTLVYESDILLPAPSWVSYAPQADLFGREVHWLPTPLSAGRRLTPTQLADVCEKQPDRQRLLILNYPSNPTGVTYGADELAGIAEVARAYRIIVLADEIYGGLNFDGSHISIARFYPEGTIVSNGLSKWCAAGGWRLGAFVIPQPLEWIRNAMIAVASETFSAVAAPVQYAAIKAFEGGEDMESYLQSCRSILKAILDDATGQLRSSGAQLADAQGGFYLFPQFDNAPRFRSKSAPATGGELCEHVLEETGVAMLPGSDFGQPPGELSTRLALVDFDGTAALEEISKTSGNRAPDADFLRHVCPKVQTGIQALCGWLEGGN